MTVGVSNKSSSVTSTSGVSLAVSVRTISRLAMKRDQVRNVVRSTNKLVLTGRANGYRGYHHKYHFQAQSERYRYYCTISINSAVTCHKASGHGRNPSLVPGHRSSGRCRKTIGQKFTFFSSHMGSSQLSELNFT